MKDHVALIDQFRGYRLVTNALDGVMKAGMILQMPNVFNAARGQIVNDENLIAALQTCVRKMRSNKACPARNQYSQVKIPL
jgi:hypothetical protein